MNNPTRAQAAPVRAAFRVLHVDTERGWRGGERQVLWLSHGLSVLGTGNVVAARAGEPLAARARDAGMHVVPLTPAFEGDPRAAMALRRAIRHHEIGVVHAHTAHAVALAAIATLGSSVPFVAARRVDFALRDDAFTRWKYGRAAAIVAVSEAVAAVVRRAGVRSPVVVVPDGTDTGRTRRPAGRAVLASLGIPPNAPLVVQVAQLVGHKDPLTFVAAVDAARARVPAMHALLVGDGPLRAPVERAIRDRGLGDILHLAGYRTDAEALLASADVVTLSSREEGMGSVLLDAMVFERPVAATGAGGIGEIVRHGDTGLLVAPGDGDALGAAIATLLTDAPLAARLATALRARAPEFSLSALAARTAAVYRDALRRRPAGQ